MAMAVDDGDDHWPSLAPIRTSAASASLHTYDTICKSSNVEENCLHDERAGAVCGVSMRSAPFKSCSPSALDRIKAADTNLARQSSCCSTSQKSCVNFFSCFSCTKQTSSPRPEPRCTPTCMRKNGPVLRSMAVFFPAGGFQSFYSSPTGKAAQLSGAFPRTHSTSKLHHLYASPRTPSGKNQHFSSPRSPGSGRNLQCLSTPNTPASGKVQHFSGAIASPRTPYGLRAASPSSARRRKSSFTLFMPPTTADKKKAADQQDEPTSPHVTCIGRVGRQTQCKKLLHKDVIRPHAHCHDTTAKKNRKKPHSGSGSSSTCHSTSSNEATKITTVLSTMEACKQNFGGNQLHNQVHGFGDESGNADVLHQVVNQGDDITLIANGHKDLMHLDSQNHGKHSFVSNVECIDDSMRSLQKDDHDFCANVRMCSVADDKVELADTPVLHATCSQTLNDL